MYLICRREFAFQVFFGDSYSKELKEEWMECLRGWGFECEEVEEYNPELPLITVSSLHQNQQVFYANLIEIGIMHIPGVVELAEFLTFWHRGSDARTHVYNFIAQNLFDIISSLKGDGAAWARLIL